MDNVTSPEFRLLLSKHSKAGKPIKLECVNVEITDVTKPKTVKHKALVFCPQVEVTITHLVPWAANSTLSAWHGLHGEHYNFNSHPFTIAGCNVSTHIDKSKSGPRGSNKAVSASKSKVNWTFISQPMSSNVVSRTMKSLSQPYLTSLKY